MWFTFNDLIYTIGFWTFFGIVLAIICSLFTYIKMVLSKKVKIKCLCKHEYEPYSAFHCNGIEYDFKCRKCGKTISIQTVTEDKFNWIEKE